MSNECLPFVNVDFSSIDATNIASDRLIFNFQNNPVYRYDKEVLLSATKNIKLALNNKNVNLQSYPYIVQKEKILPITYVDIAEFFYQYSYDEKEIDKIFKPFEDPEYVPSDDCLKCLDNLNNFNNKNYGKSLDNGICGKLSELINKIMPFVQMLKGAIGMAQSLANGDFMSVLSMIPGPIQGLISQLKSFVTSFADIQKNIIKNLQGMAEGLPVISMAKAALKRLGSLVDFFSEDNIDSIKNSLENIGQKMAAQFRNPMWIDNLLLMLLRVCQMFSSLFSFLQSPVQNAQQFINGMMSNYSALKTTSDYMRAVDASLGTRVLGNEQRSQQAIVKLKQISEKTSTPPAGGRATSDTFTDKDLPASFAATSDEKAWLSGIMKQATSGKVSDSNIKLVGGSANNLPKSITGLKRPEVLIMLRRVSQKLGTPLTITSAYRWPGYNNGRGPVGGHVWGDSLDVVWPGGDAICAQFVEYCSKVGFKRITSYRGSRFIHVDLAAGSKGGRGGWTGANQGPGPLTNAALNRHYTNRFTVTGLGASGATPTSQTQPQSFDRGPR